MLSASHSSADDPAIRIQWLLRPLGFRRRGRHGCTRRLRRALGEPCADDARRDGAEHQSQGLRRPCRFPARAADAPPARPRPTPPSCHGHREMARCRGRRPAPLAGRTPSAIATPTADCAIASRRDQHAQSSHGRAACGQAPELGCQAERGKEDQQQRIAQRVGKRHLEIEHRAEHGQQHCDEQATGDRGRNAVVGQNVNPAIDPHTKQDRRQRCDAGPQLSQRERH